MINYKSLGTIVGKVAIALVVIVCAYFFGRYQANNKCEAQAAAKEFDQQVATFNSFILAGLTLNREVVEMVKVMDQIKEDTNESLIKYIKVVERVPVHSECVIDGERLRIINEAIANTNTTIARSVSNSSARNEAN